MGLLRALWVGSRSATAAFLTRLQDEFFPAVEPFSRDSLTYDASDGDDPVAYFGDDLVAYFYYFYKPITNDRLHGLKANLATLGLPYDARVIYDEKLVAARAANKRARALLTQSERARERLRCAIEAFLRVHDQLGLYDQALAAMGAAQSDAQSDAAIAPDEHRLETARITEARQRAAVQHTIAIADLRYALDKTRNLSDDTWRAPTVAPEPTKPAA